MKRGREGTIDVGRIPGARRVIAPISAGAAGLRSNRDIAAIRPDERQRAGHDDQQHLRRLDGFAGGACAAVTGRSRLTAGCGAGAASVCGLAARVVRRQAADCLPNSPRNRPASAMPTADDCVLICRRPCAGRSSAAAMEPVTCATGCAAATSAKSIRRARPRPMCVAVGFCCGGALSAAWSIGLMFRGAARAVFSLLSPTYQHWRLVARSRR